MAGWDVMILLTSGSNFDFLVEVATKERRPFQQGNTEVKLVTQRDFLILLCNNFWGDKDLSFLSPPQSTLKMRDLGEERKKTDGGIPSE